MPDETDDGYVVGYGKPPRATRFKKNQSGNPSGKKKGTLNFATRMDVVLEETALVTLNGKSVKLTIGEIAARKMGAQLAQGDHRARAQLIDMERTTGKLRPVHTSGAELSADDEAALQAYIRKQQRPPVEVDDV